MKPDGYHVVNFLLHWANVWLVLVIVRRLSKRLSLAVLAAALFAVHPINIESVTNIVGRADLLATLICLLRRLVLYPSGPHQRVAQGRLAFWAGVQHAVGRLCEGKRGNDLCVCAPLRPALALAHCCRGKPWEKRLWTAVKEFGFKGYLALAPALLAFVVMRSSCWRIYSPVFGQIYVDNPDFRGGQFLLPVLHVRHSDHWPLSRPVGFPQNTFERLFVPSNPPLRRTGSWLGRFAGLGLPCS